MKKYNWLDMLKDSSWVTIAWEWLQSLLGRTVDFVLWVTMIFACYQLIPGAPAPDAKISIFMFILQFVALDIGGMGLRQLAQRHGLEKSAFTYKIAYACIGVTFITLIFAGTQHALGDKISTDLTTWVEVILVIARSGLTVFYGQAVRALKFVEEAKHDRVTELEEEVSNLRIQVSNGQREVSNLKIQLDSEHKKVSNLQLELDRQVSNLVSNGRREVSSVQLELDRKNAEMSSLRVQLDGKDQQITSLRETLESGMKLHESSTQQIVSSVQNQLDRAQLEVSSVQSEMSNLRVQLDTERRKVSSLQARLESKGVSTVQLESVQLDTGVSNRVSSVQSRGVQLDSPKNGQEPSENAVVEQIRSIIESEPKISARAIAARVGCSPTTASTWKKAIEQEISIVPRLHVVNE